MGWNYGAVFVQNANEDDEVAFVDSEHSSVEHVEKVALVEDYRNKYLAWHQALYDIPDRMDGKTEREWADPILGYVLYETHK